MLLDNVAVAPKAQGSGLGRLMLDFAERQTFKAGSRSYKLYTNAAMIENIRLYSRRGYRETHRQIQAGFERVYMIKKLNGVISEEGY